MTSGNRWIGLSRAGTHCCCGANVCLYLKAPGGGIDGRKAPPQSLAPDSHFSTQQLWPYFLHPYAHGTLKEGQAGVSPFTFTLQQWQTVAVLEELLHRSILKKFCLSGLVEADVFIAHSCVQRSVSTTQLPSPPGWQTEIILDSKEEFPAFLRPEWSEQETLYEIKNKHGKWGKKALNRILINPRI